MNALHNAYYLKKTACGALSYLCTCVHFTLIDGAMFTHVLRTPYMQLARGRGQYVNTKCREERAHKVPE